MSGDFEKFAIEIRRRWAFGVCCSATLAKTKYAPLLAQRTFKMPAIDFSQMTPAEKLDLIGVLWDSFDHGFAPVIPHEVLLTSAPQF